MKEKEEWAVFHELQAFDICSILPPQLALQPNDKQSSGQGSCFVMAAVVVHHHLQRQGLLSLGEDREATIKKKLGIDDMGTLHGGNPVRALKELVGPVSSRLISEFDIPSILHKRVKIVSPQEYVTALEHQLANLFELYRFSKATKRRMSDPLLASEFNAAGGRLPVFHSQAVIDVATHRASGDRYWLCRQTWAGCDITLIPVVPCEDFVQLLRDPSLTQLFHELYIILGLPFFFI